MHKRSFHAAAENKGGYSQNQLSLSVLHNRPHITEDHQTSLLQLRVSLLNCAMKLYAELCCSYKLGDYSATLVKALEHLTEWATIWQIRIANSKCCAHRISSATPTSDVYHCVINDFELQWSVCTRDLSV